MTQYRNFGRLRIGGLYAGNITEELFNWEERLTLWVAPMLWKCPAILIDLKFNRMEEGLAGQVSVRSVADPHVYAVNYWSHKRFGLSNGMLPCELQYQYFHTKPRRIAHILTTYYYFLLKANLYCEQIKASPDGWQLCLSLFVKEPKSVPEARFYALQVLENVLQNRFNTLDVNAVHYVRQTLMDFINRDYVLSRSADEEVPFLKNKFAHTITLLFINVYPSTWPTFFDDFLALIHTDPTSTASSTAPGSIKPTNHRAVDFFLRLCLSIDEEIARLDVPRGREQIARNVVIKDAMREGDIRRLATKWFELLQEYRVRDPSISEMALRIVGHYVAWMDISLVVNDVVIGLLYQLLGEERLRMGACECLVEVVNKGMKPLDKLNLIQVLNLTDVMGRLDLEDDVDFVEHVAKLTNALGVELCHIWAEDGVVPEAKAVTYGLIELVLPYLLKFLSNEYDDTCSAVFPFLNDLMGILKKQKKVARTLTQAQRDFLLSLLGVVIVKMRYDDEIDWGYGEEEAEEEALFIELRKSLKGFSDAIAAIDDALYTSYVHSVVIGTFDAFEKLGAEVDWREAELALHVLYLFGEASRGQMQFVVTQGSTTLAPLGEMLLKMVTSKISTYPHPSVPLQFFENAVRYYQFFEIRPEGIPDVLEAFVDTRGLHHSMRQIRSRSWYLFHRFVKFLRPKMGNYVEIVLGSIQDLLVIQAELPAPSPSGTDSNISANNSGSTFDSQLYLFEAVGMLISHEAIPAEKQVKYLEAVLNPLVKGIQENMSKEMYNPEDELFPLQLHHLIMAIGSVAKGFPEAPNGAASVQRPWAVVFKQATEITLMVLEALNRFEKIREATRFAFSRLVHCLGAEMLPYLPPLINSLLNEFQVTELLDFLPFVGLIGHKYKPVIFNILNDLLLPLVNKVFGFLNQTPSGTDEAVLLLDLRKAYLTFVIQLFNLDLESVFVSDLNRPHLNMILQSVLHYANDTSETVTQKMAFGILLKTVNAWGGSAQQPSTSTEPSGVGQPLPGFEQFMFESIVRVSFEVPMKQSFNLSDGQTVLAFGEISGIQKAIYAKQGTRFIEYMRGVYLPSIQCPPNMAEDYLQALQQLEMRAFKKFFQAFIQNSKS